MNLIFFTKEAYKSLKKDLEANKEKYFSDEPWLEEYFNSVGITDYFSESSITIPEFELVYSGDSDANKNQDDLNNCRIVHDSFGDKISPQQASDPLLWSGLTHRFPKIRQYIIKRWTKDNGTVSLNERFFATEGRASLCSDNAISRFWWSAHLTYDETAKRTDPYHLTKILFSRQQIQEDLFDSPLSMNRNAVKGALLALERMQEETKNGCTPIFRKCLNSYMNHYGAVTVLDSLDSSEIEKLVYDYMKAQLNN